MQKFEYAENEKSFLDEIKNIFYSFQRAIIWWKIKNLMKIANTSFKRVNIYFFKVNDGNTRTVCRICSKLTTIKTTERGQQRHPSFFDVNFEHIWCIILVSPLLNLNEWILDGTFQEVSKKYFRKNLEKSHSWPFKRLSPTRKIFKGDHWILPELKQLVTKTNHNKSLTFLMADVAPQYTVKTRFANLRKFPFI